MTPLELSELMNELPDDLIVSANRGKSERKRPLFRVTYWMPAAAVCAVGVICAAVYPRLRYSLPGRIIEPEHSAAETTQTVPSVTTPDETQTTVSDTASVTTVTTSVPFTTDTSFSTPTPFTTGTSFSTSAPLTTGTAPTTSAATTTPASLTETTQSRTETVTTPPPEETTVTTFRPEETTGGAEGTTSESAGFWYSYEIGVQREFLGTAPASGDVPFRYTITAEENAAGKQYIIIDTYSTGETLVFSADAENGALAFVIWHTEPLAEGEERHVRFTVWMPDGVQFDPALCSAQAVQKNADPYYYSTKTQYAIPLRIQGIAE